MIAIKRPPLTDMKLLERAARATAEMLRNSPRPGFQQDVLGPFRAALTKLFSGKCAFCESLLDRVGAGEIHHFRPKGSVQEDPMFPGYYWLAYEWNNLLLACERCAMSKRNHFPIQGTRAQSPSDDLRAERPLLLNPCDDDDEPAAHLLFADEGYCSGVTERGNVTVQILNLNRLALVEQRKREAERFKLELATLVLRSPKDIQRIISPEQPYAAMRRQIAVRFLEHLQKRLDEPIPDIENVPLYPEERVKEKRDQAIRQEQKKRSFSVESSSAADRALFQQGFKGIERVEIRNFKGIRSLDLSFPPARDRGAWLMLVGENATGKSSLLKALALTLIGENHANQLELDKKSLVNYEAAEHGEPCEVTAHLVGVGPIRLSFAVNSESISVDPPQPKLLLAAYGATRLLPHVVRSAGSPQKYIRIKNLFDPTAPLNDVKQWLTGLKRSKPDAFEDFYDSLRRLFPEIQELNVDNRNVTVRLEDETVALHDLSDGFQSLIALLGDIAITISDFWPSLKVAEGLVLLDEIEVHMHPRWKIAVVDRLRAACPQLTFVVTTHDPLCLKGLESEEIAVLRREGLSGVTLERNTLSVAHLRWDQVLSSFLFNLPSSRSSSAAALVARYSRLLGKTDRTRQEDNELAALRVQVKAQFSSAMTPMQSNVEEAVARTLRASGLEDPDREDVRVEVSRQVRAIVGGDDDS